jgi:membrane protease YdiL (CAAX protease family)
MLRWGRFAWAYAVLGAVCLVLIWPSRSPLSHPDPRAVLPPALLESSGHWLSLAGGIAFGLLVVAASRITVRRYGWAQRLHRELRPFARSLPTAAVVVLAGLSSLGEELLFRGLLQPWIGWIPQALLFGLVHQLPGSSRWVWASWAFVVGLVLGGLFELTGSLLGPIVAHALVNGVNLRFLQRHDPGPVAPAPGLRGRARAGT